MKTVKRSAFQAFIICHEKLINLCTVWDDLPVNTLSSKRQKLAVFKKPFALFLTVFSVTICSLIFVRWCLLDDVCSLVFVC